MKSGRKISELIQDLQSIDEQWETVFLNEEKREKETEEKLDRLLNVLRQELKAEEPETVREYLRLLKVRNETAEKLIKTAKSMLQIYMEFSLLRELEDRSDESVRGLLSTIYNKYIVRFEQGYLNNFANKKYDEEVLGNLVACITYLTDYYIARSYTMQGIIKDLEDESGLSQENCEYWGELIEQNYSMLKMNYIVSELGKIKKRLYD
mgnify:CR=1 FL=1|jgi:hypothetical protein